MKNRLVGVTSERQSRLRGVSAFSGSSLQTIGSSGRTRGHRLEPRRLPGGDPADEVGDLAKPLAEQEAGADRRAVTARAVHDDRAIARELAESLREPGQRDVEAFADAVLAPLVFRP